jgi:hypothetical protein
MPGDDSQFKLLTTDGPDRVATKKISPPRRSRQDGLWVLDHWYDLG